MTASGSGDLLRPLSPSERATWRVSAGSCLNFTTIARVRGPLHADFLRAALGPLQRRHPLLAATIDTSDPASPVFRTGAPPLGFRVASGDWRDEVDRELAERFDVDTGPLGRVVWMPDEGGGHLFLTLHHAIGDGKSGVYALRDLVAAAVGEGVGGDERRDQRAGPTDGPAPAADALAPLSESASLESRLGPRGRGLRLVSAVLRFFLGELVADRTIGRGTILPTDADADPTERRTRLVPYEFEPAFVSRLVRRARAEGTTVHGALVAAIALGIAGEFGERLPLYLGFPVDLRDALVPPMGEEVGMYVSALRHREQVAPTDPFWPLARRIRDSIAADKDAGLHEALAHGLPLAEFAARGRRSTPEDFVRRFAGAVNSSGGLTNLGRLDIATRFGPVALEAVHFAVNTSAFGVYVTTATSTDGRLNWNFMFAEPNIAIEHGRRLAAETVAILTNAVDSEEEV